MRREHMRPTEKERKERLRLVQEKNKLEQEIIVKQARVAEITSLIQYPSNTEEGTKYK